MLVYNTMRFGTDVFTLSGMSSTTPVDPPDDEDDPVEEPVSEDDSTLPKVAVRIGGNDYYFKLSSATI